MKKLITVQRKKEPPDLFAMRAWALASKEMSKASKNALALWIYARTQYELHLPEEDNHARREDTEV